MLHGHAPFEANSVREMEDQIKAKNILIKKSLSSETKSLLKKMLWGDP